MVAMALVSVTGLVVGAAVSVVSRLVDSCETVLLVSGVVEAA